MGPKKGKDGIDDNYWRTLIEEYCLDDDNWTVKVILIEAAGNEQDRMYMNKFEVYAAEERRFVIKNICKTETIFMINQLGVEKKFKDDNLRVFEEAQNYLKLKENIPSDLLALIIKHLIMNIKDEYLFIKRQRLQVREGMRRESATMIDALEMRGTLNVSLAEPDPIPTTKKGKKGELDLSTILPEPDIGKKYNTQLRVRGEEWRDKVYVDDFPTDGPNLYVAVTGFVETLLPVELLKIGVPLTAVIQVRIDSPSMQIPSSLFKTTKRRQSQTEILTEKYVQFWEDLQQFRIQKDIADVFKNTAFVIFSPPYWDTETLSGNPDKIYDELCFLMYDTQDLTRQHFHYLDNMDIINIPAVIGDIYIDKRYYQQIDDLPLECVTIYTILDAILQSVCKGQADDENSSRSSLFATLTINQPRISDDKIEKGTKLVKEVFNKLCSSEGNKKSYRITQGQEYENYKDPIIIKYGDFAKYNTFHLGNINLDNIVWSTLFGLPLHKLWDNQKLQNAEIEAKISFHLNVLLSCFDREDVETAELYRLMHILAFRKLYNNRSSLKKQHLQSTTISNLKKTYLKRSILAEPLSKCSSLFRNCSSLSPTHPSMTKYENTSDESYNSDSEEHRVKFLFECPDISELVSATEIANEKPVNHSIDDFEYFEDFTGVCAFQILLQAFNNFNCVDYKYCEVTDCFLLMFFNSHDKDGIAREEWRCHLSTPVCLQDFFDFVLEENYGWIQNEETIYDQNIILKSQSVSKDFIDPLTLRSCVEDNEVELDLLMEGSLKYEEIAQMEEPSFDSGDARLASSKKATLSPSSNDSKSSKKTKSPILSTPKNLRQTFIATAPDSKTSILFPNKPFLGYDLGDRRVEVFGKDATYFSKDGTKVASVYTLIIPINVEYIALNVSPGNNYNTFWIHKALGDEVSPENLDICESFRISTKDQVMINIRKTTYQVPIPLKTKLSYTENKHKESILKNNQLSPDMKQTLETKSYYPLCITWPNGLITESVHKNNSSVISHIKQYYLHPLPNLNEDMRCITLNGEVIIFKICGDIEILKPDASCIKITKCRKTVITSETPEVSQSETSSDKSKKLKGKDKFGKGSEHSKISASKNALSEVLMRSEEKIPQYELIIEEFESIDCNGLRQRWINDTAFDIEKLLIRTATDYCLGEVFSRRMDGTNTLLNKDGLQIVTFPNGTRIISHCIELDEETFPEWTTEEKEYFDMQSTDIIETDTIKSKASVSQKSYTGDTSTYNANTPSSIMGKLNEDFVKKERTDGYVSIKMVYTIEHANFTSVTINKICEKISIDSPNNTSVIVDTHNNDYEMQLDSVTCAKFNGENLLINYEACPECQSSTVCDIQIKPYGNSNVTKTQKYWLKMRDSFCKKILVDDEGNINFIDEPSSTDLLHVEDIVSTDKHVDNEDIEGRVPDGKSESSVMSHGKCREMYVAKTIRYFVLKRDLTCSELVHRALVEQCIQSCRWQPWCSINKYDTFGDHRNLVSLLIPVHLTESEKWLMESKFADKPKYLTYKDLKKDTGKGFYHWMRPYERFEPKPIKPDNVLPPRLPRAFILRILEQQWTEKERDELKGAKELLNAILRYRHAIESNSETILNVPIVDLRTDEERGVDDLVQAVAHRAYENLKARLEEYVRCRVKTSITTEPRPSPSEVSVEGEMDEDSYYESRALEEERDNIIKEIEAADKTSENLKRYWRRRAEEYNEEKFYQYLLREGSVPMYFRNVLGGAMWWEMNNTADEAVTEAEARKMKCVCESEEGAS